MHAIAIDLGTTTLAASLFDASSGKRLSMASVCNPQRRFGLDVVSRLAAAVNSSSASQEMTILARKELFRLCRELCASVGTPWEDIRCVAIAGNSVMEHLLLGLPIDRLALPPFRPVTTSGTHTTSAALGWPGSVDVYVFPMPSGFVGGDAVAFLLGDILSPSPRKRCALLLDLGTNAEIALTDRENIWATSAAAGPAFEGGNISCGMPAVPGAITSITIEEERLQTAVAGNIAPTGICGSAVIEMIAQLVRLGIIESDGRIVDRDEIPSNLGERVIPNTEGNAFIFYRDANKTLTLTQEDVRQFQLAVSAVRAAIEILFRKSGLSASLLERVELTGSFGCMLRAEWLETIGILSGAMTGLASFSSNGALAGVETAVFCDDQFVAAERMAEKFRVIPLSGSPQFEELFLEYINFPKNKHK